MKGFTLFELIVVVGIMVILFTAALPMQRYFQTFSGVSSAKEELVENLRLAETRAKTGFNNSAHGVFLNGNIFTLYQGPSYIARDDLKDMTKSLPGDITASGMSDINFALATGAPSATGTIIINNPKTDTPKTIVINNIGLIE